MIDKATFLMELAITIDLARKEQDNIKNALDMRLFVGEDVNSDIYCISKKDIDNLYERIKDEEEDWFIDFYENYNDIMTAEYIDVSLFKNEVDGSEKEEEEEEPTPRVYRFLITNVEYGFIDVEATSMEEAEEKVYAFDGDYFVNKNDVTNMEFDGFID